jgi:hypothetical protein
MNCKVVGLPGQIQKTCMSFGNVHAEMMPAGCGMREPAFWRGSQKSAIG